MTVVVDASFALKWVIQEENTEDALAIWDQWQDGNEEVLAPPIFKSEVTNVLHRQVRRGHLHRSDALAALDSLLSAVAISEPVSLYTRALTLAGELDVGAAYDTLYLALAELLGCDMWTADRRLVRSAQPAFTQIRWVGERS